MYINYQVYLGNDLKETWSAYNIVHVCKSVIKI